jgi:hypothetical protein
MLSTIKRFGLYGLLASLVLFLVVFYLGKEAPYSVQETLGYLSILIALSFIFFAMRDFKINVNQGQLKITQGLIIGFSITGLVALGSGISDFIYVTVLNPDFVDEYTKHQLDLLRETVSPEQFEVQSANLLQQVESLGNPFVMASVMFMTVLAIGIIVSILCVLILRSKK